MKLITCRKCGDSFPVYMVIDGITRNMGCRKFCLACSPFGKHNTRKILRDQSGVSWCSSCKQQLLAENFHRRSPTNLGSRCKACALQYYRERAKRTKQLALDYKGRRCQNCGYSKCVRALDFHHRDPMIKEFALGSHPVGKDKPLSAAIMAELDKCDLLCANCHREAHDTLEEAT